MINKKYHKNDTVLFHRKCQSHISSDDQQINQNVREALMMVEIFPKYQLKYIIIYKNTTAPGSCLQCIYD